VSALARAPGAALDLGELLVVLTAPPWLARGRGPRQWSGLPDRLVCGSPVCARAGALGHVAYVTIGPSAARRGWSCALVLLAPGGAGVLDLRPGAVVHAAPAFDKTGRWLLWVAGGAGSGEREVILLDVQTGDERVLLGGYEIRSATWLADRRIAIACVDRISAHDLGPGGTESVMFHDAVATSFRTFGTDDLYVTLDGIAADHAGNLAFLRTWHQQGRASRSDVCALAASGRMLVVASSASCPRFREDGALVVARGESLYEPATGMSHPVPGLVDFDVCPRGRTGQPHQGLGR